MDRSRDSFAVRRTLTAGGVRGHYFSVPDALERLGHDPGRLPYCLRVLLENLLRHDDGSPGAREDIAALAAWTPGRPVGREIGFWPRRILMPDSSGVPVIADFAGLRDEVARRGGDPLRVDACIPVDVVIDHSVMVDVAGVPEAIRLNMARELERGRERYGLLRWAASGLRGIRVVPPGNGIVHQINLEYLATVVATLERDGETLFVPDSLVGTDSHTPMINGLGIVGWGVGGIEAATAILGQPLPLLLPPVTGCRLIGALRPGVTATDLVLHVTSVMREGGVVGHFVEFCGPGLDALSVPDRATIANMAVEWGATMGYMPIDASTTGYLERTGRSRAHCALVERYARAQRLWREEPEPAFDRLLTIDLGAIAPCIAGPRRPDQRLALADVPASFREIRPVRAEAATGLDDGAVVIAAITSCTNTSNPRVMVGAGLLARRAVQRGLRPRPWVKTSLSPGSRRVTEYLGAAGLQDDLDALGFNTVGYGCMTCMGNSGPLAEGVEEEARSRGLTIAAVLSGNRNFEGRIHPTVGAGYLASPPLVIAYALAGSVLTDIEHDPIGTDPDGTPVYLADLWPADEEIEAVIAEHLATGLFTEGYRTLFEGPPGWDGLGGTAGPTFPWDPASTYLRPPPYVSRSGPPSLSDITGARPIAVLGDHVTTDHIAPVGAIAPDSAVGLYLSERGVVPANFDSLSSRRANGDVVARTAFCNARLRNEMADAEGSFTRLQPEGDLVTIFTAAQVYAGRGVPLVVVAGNNYGAGSSRDTAAKSVRLIGVRAVIAESFERIHRSNLIGMGVVPLQFTGGATRKTLGIDGSEQFDIVGLAEAGPRSEVACRIHRKDGTTTEVGLMLRIDTGRERDWCHAGGILPYVLERALAPAG